MIAHGKTLTLEALAARLRHDGHPVCNAKVSVLLTALRQEAHAAQQAVSTPHDLVAATAGLVSAVPVEGRSIPPGTFE